MTVGTLTYGNKNQIISTEPSDTMLKQWTCSFRGAIPFINQRLMTSIQWILFEGLSKVLFSQPHLYNPCTIPWGVWCYCKTFWWSAILQLTSLVHRLHEHLQLLWLKGFSRKYFVFPHSLQFPQAITQKDQIKEPLSSLNI